MVLTLVGRPIELWRARRQQVGIPLLVLTVLLIALLALMWAGLLAGVGALTTIVANRIAEQIWVRVFKEDPPTG